MKLSPWVFALIISCSLSYGQFGKDFEDMSQTEKMMMYGQFKKSPEWAIGLSFFPLAGYIYTENIARGLLISIPKMLVLAAPYLPLAFGQDDELEGFRLVRTITWDAIIILQLIEVYDVYSLTKTYNRRVYREIFGKEPPSFSLNLQPTYQGANLTLAHKFD